MDIGSSHTVIASGRNSELYRVPSRASISDTISSAGSAPGRSRSSSRADPEPSEMTPQPEIVMPVRRGRVVDVYAMELVLKRAMSMAVSRWSGFGLGHVGALLATPDLPEEELSLMRAILIDVGISRMHIMNAPFAAARGGGLDIDRPQGRMLMDLGGGRTRFAVFTMGELATWWQADFGGEDLTTAIVRYIADRYRRSISLETAEQVKLNIGSVYPTHTAQNMEVTAYDLLNGEGKKLNLGDSEIRDVLVDSCETLLMDFQQGFDQVPPELAGDIARYGVTLVGGGSLLEGLPSFLKERTGLNFNTGPDPENAAVRGAQQLLQNGKRGGRRAG